MADFLDFVVRDSLLNPLNITLLSTDLEQIDQGTRHGIDAQIDDTDPLGRKGAILAESASKETSPLGVLNSNPSPSTLSSEAPTVPVSPAAKYLGKINYILASKIVQHFFNVSEEALSVFIGAKFNPFIF
jgi:hypothetical protein